jgi:hypothetical protein
MRLKEKRADETLAGEVEKDAGSEEEADGSAGVALDGLDNVRVSDGVVNAASKWSVAAVAPQAM